MRIKLQFVVYAALAMGVTAIATPHSVRAMPNDATPMVAQAATPLTEADIQAVVDQLRTARDSKDVAGTLELIAPFAVTVVTVKSGDGNATMTNRLEGQEAHRQMLEQSFGAVQNRESLENYVTIALLGDNFGIAEIYQMENFETPEGEAFIAASETVLRLGRVDGQVLITSATVDGWIAARPSRN